jgi:hypothetical protein
MASWDCEHLRQLGGVKFDVRQLHSHWAPNTLALAQILYAVCFRDITTSWPDMWLVFALNPLDCFIIFRRTNVASKYHFHQLVFQGRICAFLSSVTLL